MTERFEIPPGHELISFEGTKLVSQLDEVEPTWPGIIKNIFQAPIEERVTETTFSASELPNIDRFTAEIRGEFELIGVYFYTTASSPLSHKVWPMAYCLILNRPSEVWDADQLTFRVDPNLKSPKLIRHEVYQKQSDGQAHLTKKWGELLFPSKAEITTVVKSLDVSDSVTIAKFANRS